MKVRRETENTVLEAGGVQIPEDRCHLALREPSRCSEGTERTLAISSTAGPFNLALSLER